MLLNFVNVTEILRLNNIKIKGAFHIGAYECEELGFYTEHLKIKNKNIVWIDAIPAKVNEAIHKGIPNVYNAIITDKDNENIKFNISNYLQASSILELGTITYLWPDIKFIDHFYGNSIKIDTFFTNNNLDASNYNFWNFNIEGAELLALKGGIESIKFVDAIYLEITNKELYKNCCLLSDIDVFLGEYDFQRCLTQINDFEGWGDALYIKKQK